MVSMPIRYKLFIILSAEFEHPVGHTDINDSRKTTCASESVQGLCDRKEK